MWISRLPPVLKGFLHMGKKGYDDFTDYGDPDSFEILDKNLPTREKREIRRRKEYEESVRRASENRDRRSDYDRHYDRYDDDYDHGYDRRPGRYDDYGHRSERYDIDDYEHRSERRGDDYARRTGSGDDYEYSSERRSDDYEHRSERRGDDYARRSGSGDEYERRSSRRDDDRRPDRRDDYDRRAERRDEERERRAERREERREEEKERRAERREERREEEKERRAERRVERREEEKERRAERRSERREDERERRAERRDERRSDSRERRPLKKESDRDDYYDTPFPKKKGKGLIKALIAIAIVIVLLFVGIYGAFSTIVNKFTHVDTEVSERFSSMKGAKINVLLVGDDARDGQGGQRSDTMILCSINPMKHSVAFISIMRDTYVAIPGYANNRVNASYAFGGLDLLDQTVEENFDIKLDGNMVVNFDGFMEAMAAVGPLDIELTAEEAAYMNSNTGLGATDDGVGGVEVWNLTEGVNSLTASQLLCYARMRAVGNSDWDRTERQRKLMSAAISKIKHGHFISGYKMAYEAAPYVKTDITTMGFIKMAFTFLLSGSPESYRIPVDGTYSGQMIDGMAVLVPDIEANKAYLQKFMNGIGLEEEGSTEE